MAKERIEFEIVGANVKIDAIGFSGPMCEQATKEIEAELGVVAEKQRKSEFYQKPEQTQAQRIG